MSQLIVHRLLQFAKKDHSKPYKIISLAFGVILFLGIVPGLFIWVGLYFRDYVLGHIIKIIELTVSILGTVVGLFFVLWAALTQWKIGGGTPAPIAPTQHLVVVGPYKYCRNPIEFGAILYYLGIGTYFGGITVGIIGCLLGFIIGSIYHKLIEEKELEKRFGEEYKQYKESTPFIFPRIKGKKEDEESGIIKDKS